MNLRHVDEPSNQKEKAVILAKSWLSNKKFEEKELKKFLIFVMFTLACEQLLQPVRVTLFGRQRQFANKVDILHEEQKTSRFAKN